MHAFDGPVVKAGHAERAAIANALAQHFPRVPDVIAVLLRDLRHVPEVTRLGLAETERDGSLNFVFPAFLDAMRHAFVSVTK